MRQESIAGGRAREENADGRSPGESLHRARHFSPTQTSILEANSAEMFYHSDMRDTDTLDLFSGPHVPRVRFERALKVLDFQRAVADAPPEWRDAVQALADAWGHERTPDALEALVRARREGWADAVEEAWQQAVGICLDQTGIPRVLNGEPAAAYLLRGGAEDRARTSIRRHLRAHPRDEKGWRIQARFEPVLAAVRCAFHGGPLLPGAEFAVDLVEEDDQTPVRQWLLSYGWFLGAIGLTDFEEALEVEGLLKGSPLPIAGDGRAFAFYLLAAERIRRGLIVPDRNTVDNRRLMRQISPAAFRRYLHRVT